MSEPTHVLPLDPDGRTLSKGSVLRGWREVLMRVEVLDRVSARLPPEVAALLNDPPASTAWIDMAHFECVAEAVRLELGEAELDRLFVQAQNIGLNVMLTRFASGVIRLFGASPGVVLSRASAASKSQTVGIEYAYRAIDDRSGELMLTFPFRRRMHPGIAWGTGAGFQVAADFVGVTIQRQPPVLEPAPGGGMRVRVVGRW